MSKSPVLAVVGPAASGKSEVRRYLQEWGAETLDFDRYSNELLQPGKAEYEAILRAWGTEYLLPGGELDRQAIAERVFRDKQAREQLNAIVHPGMETKLRARVAEFRANPEAPLMVVEGAILVWMGLGELFDAVVLVDAPRDRRTEWLKQRGTPPDIAGALLELHEGLHLAQLPADYRIENTGTKKQLQEDVQALVKKLGVGAGGGGTKECPAGS